MQKILILSLLTLSAYSGFSQQQFLERGTIMPCNYSGIPGITINHNKVTVILDEEMPVHSHVNGKVVSVFKTGDQLNIIVKTNEDLYVSFGNLKLVNVKKGDDLQLSAFIGLPLPGVKLGTWEVTIGYDNQHGSIPCEKAIEMTRLFQPNKIWVGGSSN